MPLIPRPAAAALLCAASLLLGQITALAEEQAPQTGDTSPATNIAKRVTVVSIGDTRVQYEQSTTAQALSLQQGSISAQLSALVTGIKAKVGDRVEKGDTLITLDCRDAQLSLDAAKASLDQAQREQKRAVSLNRKQSLSEQGLNQAETQLIQARAQYQSAKLQVQRCRIRAPYDAIVTQRMISTGSLAAPGMELLALLNPDKLELSARLLPTQARALQQAQGTEFRTAGNAYPVTLRRLVSAINPAKGTQEARFTFDADKPAAGITGRLHWSQPGRFLPSKYLLTRDSTRGIFIAREQDSQTIARFIPLPAARQGQPIPIDLPDDTQLIDQGRFGLEDGDPIHVEEQ